MRVKPSILLSLLIGGGVVSSTVRAQEYARLQLDESGKLAELTYVPPPTPHEH